jgi:hypothetical protein
MGLTEAVKDLLIQTAKALKGSVRSLFVARTVQAMGDVGKLLAERELGWNRRTIRKGMHELERGIVRLDGFWLHARKRSEDHLPHLLHDITTVVDGQSQADPQFRTTRLHSWLTANEVRRQLISQKATRMRHYQ